MNVMYRENDICVQVRRKLVQGDLIEGYTFTNKGTEPVFLYDIGIYTPFNDNYPDAQQCINSRLIRIFERGKCCLCQCYPYGNFYSPSGTGGDERSYQEL